MSAKTVNIKPKDIKRSWYVVDAKGKTLGRLATEIAHRLKGKHKPEYTPHLDAGDYIVVVNADKVAVTGNKAEQKTYYRHTGYPGGIKETNFRIRQAKEQAFKPGTLLKVKESILGLAVWGMMPHNPLGREMVKKLRLYVGEQHEHQAQAPIALEFSN